MRNIITDKQKLNHPYVLLEVELIPETKEETIAIQKIEIYEANDNETDLVTDYLLLAMGRSYSIISLIGQKGKKIILKVASL